MEEHRAPGWCKALIILLSALVIVLGCQTYRATATASQLETNIALLCKDALVTLELDLRSAEPLPEGDIYQLYEITRLHEGTTYAKLAEYLVSLSEYPLSTQERSAVADGICYFYDATASKAQQETLTDLSLLLSQYQYPDSKE